MMKRASTASVLFQSFDLSYPTKEVPLTLPNALWEEAFTDIQARGFDEVHGTIYGNAYPFGTYLEHVRFLVMDLMPGLRQLTKGSGSLTGAGKNAKNRGL